MFGNVTALEGLHVIREIQEVKYDARMLQAVQPAGITVRPAGRGSRDSPSQKDQVIHFCSADSLEETD